MNKLFFRCLIQLLCWVLLTKVACSENVFRLKGVKGEMAANIQARLLTLSQKLAGSKATAPVLKEQVEQALYPYGYFSPTIKLTGERDILINTGPVTLIKTIRLQVVGEGKDNLAITEAVSNFPLQQNQPFNSILYEKAKRFLLLAAEKEGYLHASFDKAQVFINKKTEQATIELLFNTSFRFYFGKTQFNQARINADLLHRFAPFQEGQPYSNKRLLAFNRALSQSGYFASVLVLPKIENTPLVPIDVTLEPVSRKSYAFGIGYGTDTGPRGRLDFRLIPVNRFGHQFKTSVLGSLKENRFQMDYSIPGRNPLVDETNLMSSFSTLNYSSGYANSLLGTVAQRHRLANFQRILSLNALYENFHYQEQPNQDFHAIFPKATLSWLRRKEGLFSPTGYNLTLTGLAASKSLASSHSFGQVAFDAKAALTIEAIRSRLYFHSLLSHTETKDIYQFPLSLAQLLGGADTMKAYSLSAIGPGKNLLYVGFELQKETWDKWYLTAFIDKGVVYDPLPKNPLTDVGLGLLWISPVGPIKVGLAKAVSENWQWQKGGWRLVINMGPDL